MKRSVHSGRRGTRIHRAACDPRNKGPRSGFTLVELAIAVSLLLIGMVSVATATSRMHSLRRHNRDQTLAQNAVRSVAEQIQAQSTRLAETRPDTWAQDLLALYAFGGTFGDEFEIDGLSAAPGEEVVGTITFITNETLSDADLEAEVGMPRDLNGDSVADSADVSADARILPVIITARWRGGRATQSHGTYRHAMYVMGY